MNTQLAAYSLHPFGRLRRTAPDSGARHWVPHFIQGIISAGTCHFLV